MLQRRLLAGEDVIAESARMSGSLCRCHSRQRSSGWPESQWLRRLRGTGVRVSVDTEVEGNATIFMPS